MTTENISVVFKHPWIYSKVQKLTCESRHSGESGPDMPGNEAFDDTRRRNIPHLLWSHRCHSFHPGFKRSSPPFPRCRTRWLPSNGHSLLHHSFLWLDRSSRLLFGLFLPLKSHNAFDNSTAVLKTVSSSLEIFYLGKFQCGASATTWRFRGTKWNKIQFLFSN